MRLCVHAGGRRRPARHQAPPPPTVQIVDLCRDSLCQVLTSVYFINQVLLTVCEDGIFVRGVSARRSPHRNPHPLAARRLPERMLAVALRVVAAPLDPQPLLLSLDFFTLGVYGTWALVVTIGLMMIFSWFFTICLPQHRRGFMQPGPSARSSAWYGIYRDVVSSTSRRCQLQLSCLLLTISVLPQRYRPWNLFWVWYFGAAKSGNYYQDVTESWSRSLRAAIPMLPLGGQSQQLIPLGVGQVPDIWSFTMFVDSEHTMEVPSAVDIDDKGFTEHLRWCQCFWTMRRGMLSRLSLLVLGRVEIAKVRWVSSPRRSKSITAC